METNIVLKEKDLELVVSEKTLGSLTTNAKQIRDMVKAALPKYDIVNYNDDNIDQAKKDKASLNKAAKTLNSKRLEIEREFMKPFGEFKEVVTETVNLISKCSGKIDMLVKQNEQQYKEKKRATIKTYFDGLNVNLIDFSKVFKTEWLNKTASMKSVCTDIDSIFAKVENDLSSLKEFGDDYEVLRTYYIDSLDVESTKAYAKRLIEQRERIKQEEAKIAESETKRLLQIKEEEKINTVSPAKEVTTSDVAETIQSNEPQLYTRTFKILATKEQIIALGNYMNDNNIDFERIDNIP